MSGIDGGTLRSWRRARGWDVPEMARRLRRAAREPIAAHDAVVRMVYRWERGGHALSERYELLYGAAFEVPPERLRQGPVEPAAQAQSSDIASLADHAMQLRLDGLSPRQLDELIGHLDGQWHALVKTDNLLGPRYALGGVHDYLRIIGALLRSARPPARDEVLRLGARYAESAAWLHQDSADMLGARSWARQSMEWALEAGDRMMMSWALYRRGEHASADGDAAHAASLSAAARREGGDLPGLMRAAILQQEAHAYALDKDEIACHNVLDQAHALAASPDDPGDASNGHGSFCTHAYLDMQRGSCWLKLGRPAKATGFFDSALRSLPPVYRRDRGVALSGQAAAFTALGEPFPAATAARQALGIACDAGSQRILHMVMTVAAALSPHSRLGPVAELNAALAETPAV